jgi:hypothetical protein
MRTIVDDFLGERVHSRAHECDRIEEMRSFESAFWISAAGLVANAAILLGPVGTDRLVAVALATLLALAVVFFLGKALSERLWHNPLRSEMTE